MPNYIKNILKINAPPERVQEILSQIKSDTDTEQLLDFNKIIPMADSLKVTAGSEEELCSLYILFKKGSASNELITNGNLSGTYTSYY